MEFGVRTPYNLLIISNSGPESHLELSIMTLGNTLGQKKSQKIIFYKKFFTKVGTVHLAVKIALCRLADPKKVLKFLNFSKFNKSCIPTHNGIL